MFPTWRMPRKPAPPSQPNWVFPAPPRPLRNCGRSPSAALKDLDEPGPVIDHDLLTRVATGNHSPTGRARDLPLIIGTNNNEGSLIAADTPEAEVVPELSSADLEELKSLYRAANNASQRRIGLQHSPVAPLLFRDAHFSMPARWSPLARPRAPRLICIASTTWPASSGIAARVPTMAPRFRLYLLPGPTFASPQRINK